MTSPVKNLLSGESPVPLLYRFTITIVEHRVSHFFHQNASVVTPLSPCNLLNLEIRQSTMYYAGLLGRRDK